VTLSSWLLAWVPFVQPLPVWDYWYLLVLPLCAGLAIVYKSIKCDSMRRVPREAAVIFCTIVLGLVAAALAFWVMVRVVVN
jgi:hypothetical protein